MLMIPADYNTLLLKKWKWHRFTFVQFFTQCFLTHGLIFFSGPFFGSRYYYLYFSSEETEAQRGQGTALGPSPWAWQRGNSDAGLWLLSACDEARRFVQLHSLWVQNLSISWCILCDMCCCHRSALSSIWHLSGQEWGPGWRSVTSADSKSSLKWRPPFSNCCLSGYREP